MTTDTLTWLFVADIARERIRALPDRVLWAMGFCVRVRRDSFESAKLTTGEFNEP